MKSTHSCHLKITSALFISLLTMTLLTLALTQPGRAETSYVENFSQDVFQIGSWTRTDSSVNIDTGNGWLHIAADGDVNDYGKTDVSSQLPITIEARMRLVSGGANYRLPALNAYFGSDTDNIYITYLSDYGWGFGREQDQPSPVYNNNYDKGPTGENQWVTVRASIRADGGELQVKRDGDPDFQTVATRTWSLPSTLTVIRVRQPWDAVCDVDYVNIQTQIFDIEAPIFGDITTFPFLPSQGSGITLTARIYDSSDITSVALTKSETGSQQTILPLKHLRDEYWEVELPESLSMAPGFNYSIMAQDEYGNTSMYPNSSQAFLGIGPPLPLQNRPFDSDLWAFLNTLKTFSDARDAGEFLLKGTISKLTLITLSLDGLTNFINESSYGHIMASEEFTTKGFELYLLQGQKVIHDSPPISFPLDLNADGWYGFTELDRYAGIDRPGKIVEAGDLGMIYGQVYDDRGPVGNAKIEIQASGMALNAQTNRSGYFIIAYLTPRSYKVIVSAKGYVSTSRMINVSNGSLTSLPLHIKTQ